MRKAFFDGWGKFLDKWEQQREADWAVFDVSPIFEEAQRFLCETDVYES
jgi:hypothetical protein